jgi:hemerythrin-like domain-containing protein
MAVHIGAPLDSGFDDPLGMLKDCHRRIEKFLGILCHVAERQQLGALTEEEKSAILASLHYFEEGGQRHNRDEEDSLFPRLREADAGLPDILPRLEGDHQDAAILHAKVAQFFSEWISGGFLADQERQSLLSATRQLSALYADHIRLEEGIVFPYAAGILDRNQIKAIGTEFQARRSRLPAKMPTS